MDEEELELYLDMIDRIDPLLEPEPFYGGDSLSLQQLRDDDGLRVPGCYRVPPKPTE